MPVQINGLRFRVLNQQSMRAIWRTDYETNQGAPVQTLERRNETTSREGFRAQPVRVQCLRVSRSVVAVRPASTSPSPIDEQSLCLFQLETD